MASRVALCSLVAFLLASSPRANRVITCGKVSPEGMSCMNYLNGTVQLAPPPCRIGLKRLNDAAKTTSDLQASCHCVAKTPYHRQRVCDCLRSYKYIGYRTLNVYRPGYVGSRDQPYIPHRALNASKSVQVNQVLCCQ